MPFTRSLPGSYFKNPNFYAIFFFTNANANISIDGIKRTVYDKYIVFYYPYQKLEIEGDFSGFYIQFHPDFFCIDIHAKDIGCQGLLFNNFLNDTVLSCSTDEYKQLYRCFLHIEHELKAKDIGQLDMVSSWLKMFLITAVRIKRKQQQAQIPAKDNLHLQIEKLIDIYYIHEGSPEFYAQKMNVSVTTFNRLCNKYFKNSFVTIMNLKKIAVAKNKLFLSNDSIKSIAYEVGYNDPLYFTRVFKKYCGVSPGAFRKQLRDTRLV